jgi:septal ring factor EnvC (AmiA/AmiB activator)
MKCYMLLLLLVAGSALPNTNSLPMVRNSSHPQSQPPQTQSPLPVAPSYNQSHNQSIQTYRHLTQASSAVMTTPIASKKVEQFAKKLRDDIEAQERVLQTYIRTVQTKHDRVKKNLKAFKAIIADLRRQIANATTYEQKYISEDSVISNEFSKSQKMYKDEAANLKFEKAFLEEIIKYIKLRKC